MQKAEKDFPLNKLNLFPLKNQKSFDLVNKRGNKIRGNNMLMVSCLANDQFSTSSNSLSIHLGLKISKKLGKAVTRNKIRRRIKSIVHHATKTLPSDLWENKAFIIVPRKGFDLIKYSLLEEEIMHLIQKSST